MTTEPACWAWPVTDEIADHVAAYLDPAPLSGARRGWLLHVAMQAYDGGRCAICGQGSDHRAEDHDHVTGLVRGWLCRSCNTREGMNRSGTDDIWAKYRRRYPFLILGIRERYFNPMTNDFAPELPVHDRWKDNPMRGIG